MAHRYSASRAPLGAPKSPEPHERIAAVPTVATIGAYRFFFYSNEGFEPPHIHVREGKKLAKFWLEPVSVASSTRFAAHELNELVRLVMNNREEFLEAWNEHFGSTI